MSEEPRKQRSSRRGRRDRRHHHEGGPTGGPAPTPLARAERALRELRGLAFELLHGEGLAAEDAESIVDEAVLPARLGLALGTDGKPAAVGLVEGLHHHLRDLVRARRSFLPGYVYCFLCDAPDCAHARPQQRDETFAGYTATGRPVWQSFTNLCLERGEARVDRLYADQPEIIGIVQTGHELTGGLLPGFGGDSLAYNVLGQVVAGLVPADLRAWGSQAPRVALTLQLVESAAGASGPRLSVNLIGLSREEVLHAAATDSARGPAERLRRIVRVAQQRVQSVARRGTDDPPAPGGPRDSDDAEPARSSRSRQAITPLLNQLRGDLERIFRPVQRRTKHGQERHLGGERPTSDAMRDASNAADEHLLGDAERGTIVVLGPRGRAHVFSPTGRLVTSLRLRAGELERKLELARWKPLAPEMLAEFRKLIEERSPEDD